MRPTAQIMNIIKEYTKGDYTLSHSWYLDDFNVKRAIINISFRNGDSKINIPYSPPLRVANYSLQDTYSGDDISPYSDLEYKEMIDRIAERNILPPVWLTS